MLWVKKKVEGKVSCALYKSEVLKGEQWYNLKRKEFYCEECKRTVDESEAWKGFSRALANSISGRE